MIFRTLTRIAAIAAAGVLCLIVLALTLGRSMAGGDVIVAYAFDVRDNADYLVMIDTSRRFHFRKQPPIDVWRRVLFSPDGRRALIPSGAANTLQVAHYHIADGVLTTLPDDYADCHADIPVGAWSADSAAVVFSCEFRQRGTHIWAVDDPDNRPQSLLDRPADRVVWSPDGRYIALAVGRDLHLLSRDGTPLWILQIRDGPRAFTWSPDGERLAFVNGAGGLSLYDIAGDSVEPLYHDGYRLDAPAWSPDGRYIAFIEGARGELMALDMIDGGSHRLAEIDGHRMDVISRFNWSPDGGALLSERAVHRVGEGSVYVVAADGAWAHALSERGIIIAPVWSPDSAHAVFIDIGLTAPATNDRLRVVALHGDDPPLDVASDDGGEAYWAGSARLMAYIRRDFSGLDVAPRQLYIWQPAGGDTTGRPLLNDAHSVIDFRFVQEDSP
ncbi:MAG: hypothetical protein EA396_08055 [Anaerolineaceae bacterium]|nr:MAG: hypothetical protein EA396_08055 [Anaerolineaceae bacterium]